MKVLFVGIGSIGTRHLKNLVAICEEQGRELEIDALRSSDRPLPEEVEAHLRHQYSSRLQVTGKYDVIFITNPTQLHFETIAALAKQGKTLFIEKPLFESDSYSLAEAHLVDKKAYVACPMRYTGTFIALKKLLQSRRVYSTRVICSSYLPDWRKGVDYRKNYSAQKAQGGGVAIDLIHEWDYLIDLFGFPKTLCHLEGKMSHLEIDSEDIAVYIAGYNKMLAEVHLDYFGRTYRRTAEFFTEEGTVVADFGKGEILLENGERLDLAEEPNERYIREMRHFLAFADGKAESSNPPELALRTLSVALGRWDKKEKA